MSGRTDFILVVALALAGLVFWRLYRRGVLGPASSQVPAPPAPGAPGTPPGAAALPLGQFAVAPENQWLLLRPGQ